MFLLKSYLSLIHIFPVKDVTAEINEHSLSITDNGYQQYEVTVEENGYLLLDVYSATGMHSSHGMEITGIDTDAPAVIGHSSQGDLIIIQISDGDGVGVDYDSITAYTEASGYPVSPAWCNEAEGTIAFTVPEETRCV